MLSIRIKSRTGKSAEDIRKLFPNFYISNWSRNGNSTPTTPAVSGRQSRPSPADTGKIIASMYGYTMNRQLVIIGLGYETRDHCNLNLTTEWGCDVI